MLKAHTEYGVITIFKTVPLITTILLAIQISPRLDFALPVSYELQLFNSFLAIIWGIMAVEWFWTWKENGGGISGFNIPASVLFILFIAGIGLTVYTLWVNYIFDDSNLNDFISAYMGIGAFAIFIHSREEIFHHKAILSVIRAKI